MRTHKALLFIGFLALAALSLLGCSQAKKIERAKRTLSADRLAAAQFCAVNFPITPSTKYLPGKTVFDTVYYPVTVADSFSCPPSDTVVKYKIDVQTRKVIERRVDTVVKEIPEVYKVAELDILLQKERQYNKENTDKFIAKITKLTDSIKARNKLILWLLVIVVIESLWLLRKPILRLLLPVIPTV